MRNNAKRILALIMTVTMLLMMVPMEIFAQGSFSTVDSLEQTEAEVTLDGVSTQYGSFADAVTAWTNASSGAELKLQKDVITTAAINFKGTKTLDLNGYGIRYGGSGKASVLISSAWNGNSSPASLTINDSNPERIHKITLSGYRGTAVKTVNTASTTSVDANGNGTVYVNGGYITGGTGTNLSGSIYIGGAIYMRGDTKTATINGGTFVGNACDFGGLAHLSESCISITGGSFIYNKGNGAAFNMDGEARLYLRGGEIAHNTSGIRFATGNNSVLFLGGNDKSTSFADNGDYDITLSSGRVITIGMAITSSELIHVKTSSTGTFTKYWSRMGDADPADYFTCDPAYFVVKNSNGEAELINRPAAGIQNGNTVTYYNDLSSAVSNWTAGSTLKLFKDVTIGSTITVASGEHTLDLNGHGIKMTGSGSVINAANGATLNVEDSNPDVVHRFTVANAKSNGAGLATVNDALTSGYKTFTGGYITGGSARTGGGIMINGTASLTLNGGTVIGNQSSFMGAGIKADNNGNNENINITVNGGAVIYNTVNGYGAGICSDGAVRINGGTIAYNVASNYPGGIHSHYLYLNGGSIENNFAGATDYACGAHADHEVYISGNPVVLGNLTNGNPVNLDWDRTEYQHGHRINIVDALTEGAKIGVTIRVGGIGEFTSGWKDKMGDADPTDFFTSDSGDYKVIKNASGEAELINRPAAGIQNGNTVTYYNDFSSAVSNWTAGSTLKLFKDVTIDSTITVPSGEHTLDLNGHSIKAASSGYSVLSVGSGAELVIDDTAGGGKITGGSVGQNYGGGVTVDGGRLTLKGGAISGNVNIYSGIGNCGGGIHVKNSGQFYMEGGEISGNTSYVGGGICSDASDTTVSITGGVIRNNTTERFGSAVWAGRTDSATFRIGGNAEIVGNISKWTADKDGEATVNFTRLLLSGDPTIQGDWNANGTSSPNTHINFDNSGSGIQCIELDGELTNSTGTAKITISPIYRWSDLKNGQSFVFTKNWNQYMGTANPADYFKVDDSVSGVKIIRRNGEAVVAGSSVSGDLYITFDANEGEGTMEPQLVAGTTAALGENAFTREGYCFAGWNTKKDGSGTGYTDKASVTLTGDLTLYAQWKEAAACVISGETTTNYGSLSEAVNAWTAGSTLKLLADVTTRTMITVPSGEHTLALNGHTITRTDVSGYDNFGLVITLGDGANLTVIGPGKVTGGKGYHGGGIHVEGNSSLVLDNCEISGNAGQFGGGLYLRNGTITMKNGTVVKDNIALAGYGGSGIYAEGSGTLIMDGCTFTNNEIQNENQYAVFLCGNANMKVSGAPVINNNTYGSAQHDLYLYQAADQHSYVLMKDSLTDGAKIIVGQTIGAGVITNGWKANMGDTDPAKYFASDNADYTVILKDGEAALEYPPVPDVSASDYTGNYDGAAHGITVSAPEGATIQYGTEEGSYTLDASPAYTNAGSYTVYYQVSQAKRTSVSGSAVVKINKIDATVTITGHSATANYDGEEHGAEGYDVSFSTPLYTAEDFSFSGTAQAKLTNAGTNLMGLAAEQFQNTNNNFETVTFAVTDGFVTVNPIDVTVTITGHTLQADYDGTAHSVDGYDAAFSTPLYTAEDFSFSGRAEAVRTNKGVTQMGLAPEQFQNKSANFAAVTFVVNDGYITIDPIDVIVTISGHNETADYDGKAHTISGYDVSFSNALYTEDDFTFSGNATAEMTDAGTAKMGLAPEQFENINENFATVAFVVNDGYLTINPIDVTTTITGHNTAVDYDGKAHSVSGYDFASENTLYTEADFIFSGDAQTSGTDAGTTKMGLKAAQFENTNPNFATVTFEVTDGFLTINPIDVTVIITGHNNTADYDGKAHSADGYDVAIANPLYTEADFSFSGRAEAVRTDVGTTAMGLAAEQFQNTNANFATVTFAVTDGYQKITPVNAIIKSAPHAKATLAYNGESQTLCAAGVAYGGTLYYALGKDEKTAPADSLYKTSLPTAKEIGNYYIWYLVKADSNHNSLSPVVFKVTLADPNWVTISGKIRNNDKTPIGGADVILMSGNQVVDTIISSETGEYYFTVPAGVYNIVVKSGGKTVTNIADITGDTTSDIVMPAVNTDSVLNVVDSDKSIAVGGLEKEAEWIRAQENIDDDVGVTVSMTVKAIAESDTDGAKVITDFARDKYVEFYDLSVEKTVGSVVTKMDTTHNILEIVIPCSFTNKREIEVFTCNGAEVTTLTLSDSKKAGTYRVDAQNGLIYIYTNSFATVALAYQPYFSVLSNMTLGSFAGEVSVKLVKDSTGQVFELNHVSLQNISFTGVPKGTYTMTVTWTDGAENTLTLPFTIG